MSDEEMEEMLDVPFVFWTCPSGCRAVVVWSPGFADAECKACGRKRSDGPVVAGDQQRNKSKDGWVSVKDRLPETSESVLIYAIFPGGLEPYLGFYHEGIWHMIEGELIDVTHWQPLPNPPEAE